VATYNTITRSIDIQKGATSARNTRDYRIFVYLKDDSKAVLITDNSDGKIYLVGKKEYSFTIRCYDAIID
jgi:PHD/YefM family antitoxin component YafN of YafNO toxin-antitoxin module